MSVRRHRFFTGKNIDLKKDFWLRDEALLWQWGRVLRFREDQEVILFDGVRTDRLYKITKITKTEAHLELVTELERQIPLKHVYLFWSLLKKDNNDLVLQKCTELGVSNFVPLFTERSIRDNFNVERAKKIVQEASEQCGRSNIPVVREPINFDTAIKEYKGKIKLYVAEQNDKSFKNSVKLTESLGVFVGPEGGWSEKEKSEFLNNGIDGISCGQFTLRAETASIVVTSKLLQ